MLTKYDLRVLFGSWFEQINYKDTCETSRKLEY